jgi:lipid A 4'-phosphatase
MAETVAPTWRRVSRPWPWVALVLTVLLLFPDVDLAVSSAFYAGAEGFPWRRTAIGEFVRQLVPDLIIGSLVIVTMLWLVGRIRRRLVLGLTGRHVGYLIATLVIGPGLIVESLLKPNWGRARPSQLAIFGGTAEYSPPLVLADACARNCSFVSGHAAVAFWVTAYGFIAPPPWRMPLLAAGTALGLAVGMMRVMQGAHFISDVAYAGAIVVGVNLLVARWMLRGEAANGRP